jgi:hypothetical protein
MASNIFEKKVRLVQPRMKVGVRGAFFATDSGSRTIPPRSGIGHNNVGGIEFRGRNLLLPADQTQAVIRVWPFSAIGAWSILLTSANIA